jgi:ATP-dependent DNA ligase
MTEYETLYTKDSLGNTRIWYMIQDGEEYQTVSGILNGNLVTSSATVAKAKNTGKANATTSVEQATKEIEAAYKKQRKTGYFGNVEEIGTFQYVEPMLAKSYKDYSSKINFAKENYILQCKFNGNRCLATKDGLFTRKGEKYLSVPHIEESLRPFFERYPTAVLDGELYNFDLRASLNELSKLIRRTVHITQSQLEESKEKVRFYCYDGFNFANLSESEPYQLRKKWIDENIIGKYGYISQVFDHPIKSQEDLDREYNKLIDQGEEGGILRNLCSPYEHKRSKNLLKVKSEMDSEALVLDVIEGLGNWANSGKVLKLQWKGKIFNATLKGSFEEAVEVLKNKQEWIGKTVTFLYNDETGLGTPNFARVDYRNCFKTDR